MGTQFAYAEDVERTSIDSTKYKKIKKPGFFKRWLYKIAEESWNERKHELEKNAVNAISMKSLGITTISAGAPNIDQPERAIRFTVYNANGGRVIETQRYDRQKDRHANGLYVITSEMDFGREIDKIITMEALR